MASEAADTRMNRPAARARSGAPQGLIDRARVQSGKFAEQGIVKIVELADGRKDEAVDKLDVVADVVRNFADTAEAEFGPMVGRTVRRGSGAIENVAKSLRDRSITDMAQDSRAIIARHPGLTIGAVSLLGFVAGRVAKGGMARNARSTQANANAVEASA